MMSDETNNNVDRADLQDRLIDRGLREVVGGEKPPQLSAQILAAAAVGVETQATERAPAATAASKRPYRLGWLQFALAACLLIAAGVGLLLPALQIARESAQRANRPEVAVATSAPARSSTPSGPVANDEWSYGTTPNGDAAGERTGETLVEGRDKLLSEGQTNSVDFYAVDGADPKDSGVRGGTPLAPEARTRYSEGTAVNEELARLAKPLSATLSESAPGAGEPAVTELSTSGDAHYASSNLSVQGESGQQGQASERQRGLAPSDSPDNRYYFRQLADSEISGNGAVREFGLGLERESRSDSLGAANSDFDQLSETAGLQLGIPLEKQLQWGDGSGNGPQAGGDQYARIVDNPFHAINAATTDNRLSTFSIDVDTASYANVRQFLMDSNTLPPPDAVRIEELVNYFDYDYSAPTGDVPFASNVEVAACPWQPEHRLVRVGIKGREMERTSRPKSNLVFLVDVSGSMDEPNKLPLVVEGLRMLTRELGENDRIAIVVYASSEGLVLESTRGDQQQVILDSLNRLSAGGSTAGGAGIVLAYKIAEQNFIKDGVNRVILCTDGDFNVGVTSTGDLQRLAEEKAKNTSVFLTVLGFGRGNLNDAMMEAIADHGNGNYHYVDNRTEARKVLVEEMTGTLVTIAKDVKIQIEFNPAAVAGYRLIGYENRVLAAEDFNDDKKDAGEIGAGHTVTALYEIVPTGQKVDATSVDALKYAPVTPNNGSGAASAAGVEDAERVASENAEPTEGKDAATRDDSDEAGSNGELLTLKIRYKEPDGDVSTKLEFPVSDNDQAFSEATADFQFASAVAGFGMLLRGSPYKGDASFAGMLEIAESASRDRDERGYRREFCDMIRRAKELAGY
jgi:Ca-activated chloride channel family protein